MNRTEAQPMTAFFRTLNILLTLMFFVKLAGFFTWSENVGITRVIKIGTRMLMTAYAFMLFHKVQRKGAVASFVFSNQGSFLLYIAYLLLGLVSFLWSTNVGYSALQWVMDVESLVFAYYFIGIFLLLDHYFPQSGIRLSRVLAHAILLMGLIFLVGMIVDPDAFYRMTHGGEEARLGGFFMNPNELGMLGGVGISCFIFDLYGKQKKVWVMLKILALLYMVVLTGSRSSIIGCLLIAFFHIRQTNNTKLKAAMYIGAMLSIPLIVNKVMIKQGGLEEVLSMTGRLPFWKALITEGLPRELMFGFGFMRIDYKEHFESVHTYAGHMTHNTFIQVLMNLGLVGFTLVLFQLFFSFRGIVRLQDQYKKLLLIGICIPIFINSFTEFGIFGETNYGILFYQMIVCYLSFSLNPRLSPREKRRLMRSPNSSFR